MKRNRLLAIALASVCLLAMAALLATTLTPAAADAAAEDEGDAAGGRPPSLVEADTQFERKNYQQAADAYVAALDEAKLTAEQAEHAAQRAIASYGRLNLFDPALTIADRYAERVAGSWRAARAHRLAGNLWMNVPHWGTRSGGEFHRGQWKQGIQLHSHRHDKKQAMRHFDLARKAYATWDPTAEDDAEADSDAMPEDIRKNWREERIGCLFDYAAAAARFGIFESQPHFWHSFWGERDDRLAETVGEEDFDEYHSHWQWRRKRPIGLPVTTDGEPIFPTRPDRYDADVQDDRMVLFLLDEIRRLDPTDTQQHAARSYYRQAMLARARFGMDRINGYAGLGWSGAAILREDLDAIKPWELKRDEAIILAGGEIQVTELPDAWNVLGLLDQITGPLADSGVAPEAGYAEGLYLQSRQQYLEALKVYERVAKRHLATPYAGWSRQQQARIRQGEVEITPMQVQLPGDPGKVQVRYRNTDRIHFVARRIDLPALMQEIRHQQLHPKRGFEHWWNLQNWSWAYVNNLHHRNEFQKLAGKHLGEEIARWSRPVENDGTHRYAEAVLTSEVSEPGAYLIHAYLKEPPRNHADLEGTRALGLGASRAVMTIEDIAYVQKNVPEGTLLFICDARSGAPIPGAEIEAIEVWYDGDRHQKTTHKAVADETGLATIERPERSRRGQFHFIATAPRDEGPDRFAWSGMSYWQQYSPSQMRQGRFAYLVTDRPVYRPEQTVNYKIWFRDRDGGGFKVPRNQPISFDIYDARGDKLQTVRGRTDEHGGFDGQFTLDEEPPLGVYSFRLSGARVVSGVQFRVEEYKKPEFEVTVEPGSELTKLGETVPAIIKGKYLFGQPVAGGEVSYKVFREEFRSTYYPPGPWVWLYGPGYGLPYYPRPWVPRWDRIVRCWAPPVWWHGPRYGANPVRELVMQGEGELDEDGELRVEIDTSDAARDHSDLDHRYVVEAEVRDASRRVITGSGSVLAANSPFYAHVYARSGWNRPGEPFNVTVRTLTASGEPVQTSGVVTISEIIFGGPGNAKIDQRQLARYEAETDERGELQIDFRHEKSGQYKVEYEAPDRWGGTVVGFTTVWVVGDDFTGQLHRFNDIELITDKRTYQPGDTARVMVNTAHPGSWVLFSSDADRGYILEHRMLHLKGRSTVVDVPVGDDSKPNFFIEATTVHQTRVHTDMRRILVPPSEGVLNVQVATDKPEYKPGEQATLRVKATTLDGEPARAQFAVTGYDRAVTYIASRQTTPIARFFHGQLRNHRAQSESNVYQQLSAQGSVSRPYQQMHPAPPDWHGDWGPTVGDWRTPDDDVFQGFAGQGGAMRATVRSERLGQPEMAMDSAAGPSAAPAPAREADPNEVGSGAGSIDKVADPASGEGGDLVEPSVREQFADTAIWLADLVTGDDGSAEVQLQMPENLTTWNIESWALTADTRVGEASTRAVTTKNLLVRLQAPRFFKEHDEVVVSANVHNYLAEDKQATVSFAYPSKLMRLIGETPSEIVVDVPAGDHVRVDWRVRVIQAGEARLVIAARTDEESDAMAMTYPVMVHGMLKQVARTGMIRPDDGEAEGDESPRVASREIRFTIPDERRPELSRLEVQFAPSLVGAMLDALPYTLEYPYGCTEQTMSRFLPAVLTRKTLTELGVDLEDVKEIQGRMAEVRRIEKGEGVRIYADSPVFDSDKLDKMIRAGLKRIASMQNGDGGWGWWSADQSNPYLTSYVLFALIHAKQADADVDQTRITRGLNFLVNWEQQEMRDEDWAVHARHAYVAYVLALEGRAVEIEPAEGDDRKGRLLDRLFEGRDRLNLYGKALLALALSHAGDDKRAELVLETSR